MLMIIFYMKYEKSEVLNKALRKDGELIFIVSPSFCLPHYEFLVVESNDQRQSQYHWHCNHGSRWLYLANDDCFGQPFLVEWSLVADAGMRLPALG